MYILKHPHTDDNSFTMLLAITKQGYPIVLYWPHSVTPCQYTDVCWRVHHYTMFTAVRGITWW